MAGRKPLPPQERRTIRQYVMFSADGKQRIIDAARAAGFNTVSLWAWTVLRDEAERVLAEATK